MDAVFEKRPFSDNRPISDAYNRRFLSFIPDELRPVPGFEEGILTFTYLKRNQREFLFKLRGHTERKYDVLLKVKAQWAVDWAIEKVLQCDRQYQQSTTRHQDELDHSDFNECSQIQSPHLSGTVERDGILDINDQDKCSPQPSLEGFESQGAGQSGSDEIQGPFKSKRIGEEKADKKVLKSRRKSFINRAILHRAHQETSLASMAKRSYQARKLELIEQLSRDERNP